MALINKNSVKLVKTFQIAPICQLFGIRLINWEVLKQLVTIEQIETEIEKILDACVDLRQRFPEELLVKDLKLIRDYAADEEARGFLSEVQCQYGDMYNYYKELLKCKAQMEYEQGLWEEEEEFEENLVSNQFDSIEK